MLRMLYDTAALSSGYTLEDPNLLSQRLQRLVATSLEIDPNFEIEEEEFPEEPVAQQQEEVASQNGEAATEKVEAEAEVEEEKPQAHEDL